MKAAIGLVVVAAALCVFAAFSHAWWSSTDGTTTTSYGLLSYETCTRTDCSTTGWTEVKVDDLQQDTYTGFAWGGRIAFGGDLIALVGAAITIVALVKRNEKWVKRRAMRWLLGFAGLGAFVVSARYPPLLDRVPRGIGFYAQWAGIALAYLGEYLAGKTFKTETSTGS